MREVKYQRPKNFVDPFAPKPETDASPTKRATKGKTDDNDADGSPGGESAPASSSAHVHRVRNIRASGQAHKKGGGPSSTSPTSAASSSGGAARRNRPPRTGSGSDSHTGSRNRLSGPHSQSGHSRHDGAHHSGGEGGDFHDYEYEGEEYDQYYGEDGYEDEEYEDGEGDEEFKELLAEARRDIRISEEVAHGKGAHNRAGHHPLSSGSSLSSAAAAEVKLVVTAAVADIRCWLVNSEAIVISVVVQEEDRNLEAEAEISIEDLAVLRGEDPSLLGSATTRSIDEGGGISIDNDHQLQPEGSVYSLAFDLPTLQQIAAEMVSHVELRVDLDSGARLILNLVSEEEETPAEDAVFAGDSLGVEMMGASAAGVAAATAAARAGNVTGAGSGGGTGPHSAGKPALHGSGGSISGVHPLETQSLVSEEELGDMLIDGKINYFCAMVFFASYTYFIHHLLFIIGAVCRQQDGDFEHGGEAAGAL